MRTNSREHFSVYILECPNGKRYVGCTSYKPWQRWDCGRGYTENRPLYEDIKKYGWDSFKRIILKSGMSCKEAAAMEIQKISELKTMDPHLGYNRCNGGENTGGIYDNQFINITKEQITAFQEACDNFNKGEK